jgi:hypothetical protein
MTTTLKALSETDSGFNQAVLSYVAQAVHSLPRPTN